MSLVANTMHEYNYVTNTYTGCDTTVVKNLVCPIVHPAIDPNRLLHAVTKAESKQQSVCVNTADLYNRSKRSDAAVQLVASDVNSLHDSIDLVASSIDGLHTEVSSMDRRTSVLESGVLVSGVAYSTGPNGGASVTALQNGESIVNSDGTTSVTPASLELTQFNSNGTNGASVKLDSVAVTLSDAIVDGVLQIGNITDTEGEIDELKQKVFVLEAESIANLAVDASQYAAIAANAAASFFKPPGYVPLPPDPDVDLPEVDPNSTSVEPLTLAPAGLFDATDPITGAIQQTVVPRGKVGINETFPTRALDVKGDVRQVGDADDVVGLQSLCRLGSAVQQTDEQLNATNPTAPCVYLGRNALIDVSGTYQGEAVNVDRVDSKTIHCTTVNGTNPVRALHCAQVAAPSYSRRIAQQANRVSYTTRAAKRPRVSINKDFTEDVVRLHAEVSDVRRTAYHGPVIQKDYTESIVAVHDELAQVRRVANSSAPSVSKNFSTAIAALARRPVTAVVRTTTLMPDFRASLRRVSTQIATIQRQLSKPALAKNFSKAIADVKKSAAASMTATPDTITFTSKIGPKLNLYNTSYAVGVQDFTTYLRTDRNIAFYKSGSHVDGELQPGAGGSLLMKCTGDTTIPINGSFYVGESSGPNLRMHHTASGSYIDYGARTGVTVSNSSLNFRNQAGVPNMALDHQGNLNVRGYVNDVNGFRFFRRVDIYFEGLVGERQQQYVNRSDQYLFDFGALKSQVWLEITVMAYVIDGSGNSNEDVILITPALFLNGSRSFQATPVGNLVLGGALQFRRGQNMYQTKGQLFNVQAGQNYTAAALEQFVNMNDRFGIHYSHLTIREP
jgi:hypothetical protein